MKQVTCSQMRVVSEDDLQQIFGGVAKANTADQSKNNVPAAGSGGCVAGAQRAAQGRNPNFLPKG